MKPADFYDWEIGVLHTALRHVLKEELYERLVSATREIAGAGDDHAHAMMMYGLCGMNDGEAPDRSHGRKKHYQAWQVGKSLRRLLPIEQLPLLDAISMAWPAEPEMFHHRTFNDDVDELSEAWVLLAPLLAGTGFKEPPWLLELFLAEDPGADITELSVELPS